MEKASLNRRDFLRLCVVGAGSVIAAACQKALTETVAFATSTAVPSLTPSVKVDISGGSRDVWTWIKQIKVGVSEGDCEKVIVHVNAQEFEAHPEDESFTAEIQLSEG